MNKTSLGVWVNRRLNLLSILTLVLIGSFSTALTGSKGAAANKNIGVSAKTATTDDFELVPQNNLSAPLSDANCLMLNPQFRWQINHAVESEEYMKFPDTMDTDICNDNTFNNCSGLAQNLQADIVDKNLCVMCRLHKLMPNGSRGHVNWFPATYTGRVCFHNFNFPDMDYTFSFQPDGGNGLTRWNAPAVPDPDKKGIPQSTCKNPQGQTIKCSPKAQHIEFDSRETIERFRSSEWTKFRKDASPCLLEMKSCHPDQARNDVSMKRAVVIGLFGLDAEHNIYSELHPVYAIAIEMHSDLDRGESTWMIFARNKGDEGACSLKLHSLYGPPDTANGPQIPLNYLKLLIPPPPGRRATGASYSSNTQFYSNNGRCPTAAFYDELFHTAGARYDLDNQGILLNFDLNGCGDDCLVEGTLNIKWDLIPLSEKERADLLLREKKEVADTCVSEEELDKKESGEIDKPTTEQARKLRDLLVQARAEGFRMFATECPYSGRIQSASPQTACTNLLTRNWEGSLPDAPYEDIINILQQK